jgi:two-component system, chemotaxis family, chemotaxis protein CheY
MGKSLLIVDDSATMRKIIIRSVRMSGIQFDTTEEAGNGIEALDKLNSAPVDVILCDVNMPEMNGDELVKKVREMDSCKDTKIVMVSTESAQDFIDSLLACGADDYITKPFTPDKFNEKLSPLL